MKEMMVFFSTSLLQHTNSAISGRRTSSILILVLPTSGVGLIKMRLGPILFIRDIIAFYVSGAMSCGTDLGSTT